MPAGRASMQMTLTSQGRSASALTGALSGSGTVTLESARIAGLDPRAFEVAIRASDSGQATDDVRLRQIVEAALVGRRAVRSRRRRFRSPSGTAGFASARPRWTAMASRAIVSGGYDIPADQADIRAALLDADGSTTGRPEIQLFAVGTPDALDRTVDVAALSSWLAVRAIDRETRRLDAIERGEPPPPAPPPIVLPADGQAPIPEAALPSAPVTTKGPAAIRGGLPAKKAARRARRHAARRQCAAGARRRPAAGRAAAAADRRAAGAGRRQAEAAAASAAGADAAGRQSAAASGLQTELTQSTISRSIPIARKNASSWLTAISAPSNPCSASSSSSIEARSRWLVGSSSSRRNGGCGRAKTQARPARSRSPPESVAAICSAARLRNANRASAAWASLAESSGFRRRRLSRMLEPGSSRPIC